MEPDQKRRNDRKEKRMIVEQIRKSSVCIAEDLVSMLAEAKNGRDFWRTFRKYCEWKGMLCKDVLYQIADIGVKMTFEGDGKAVSIYFTDPELAPIEVPGYGNFSISIITSWYGKCARSRERGFMRGIDEGKSLVMEIFSTYRSVFLASVADEKAETESEREFTVYRYMSMTEFEKLMAGEELVNNDPHDGQATDSVGFCFLPGTICLEKNGIYRHCSPNDAIRFLDGIVSEDVLVEFQTKARFKKAVGRYEDPWNYSMNPFAASDYVYVKELSLTAYSKELLRPVRYCKGFRGDTSYIGEWEKIERM